MLPRQPRVPLRLSSLSPPRTTALWARAASRSSRSNPWPDIQGSQPEQPKVRTWVGPVSRIANFLIIPTAILYAVFFHEFGDHEHVFQPPRRWLESQKAAFFSLSPEEQKLAGLDGAAPEPEPPAAQGSGTPR